MGEFELIRRYFQPLAENHGSEAVVLGVGDDCAVQRIPEGRDLVFSIDTMVEGIHFPQEYCPDYLGWRALAAATSDLAAMGAAPVCFTLALTLPEANEQWLTGFARGLSSASESFGLVLAGGDTTRGPLVLSMQVHGTVRRGEALRRSGARAGDLVLVSGTLGDAGAALDFLEEPRPSDDMAFVLGRYHQPRPRLDLGASMVGLASSCIDISDGLIADLGHVLKASGVGATVDVSKLPLSAALCSIKGIEAARYGLSSGDDYELCLTIPPERWKVAPEALKQQLTIIGAVEQNPGLRLRGGPDAVGNNAAGFDHFGGGS
ncbi:thiamine-phosphate kinase [Marinobacter salinus]|uniref:Thiamine-monophosphate kinase n=1 Tax=Marinobacter salinus TaxID=1874317 RepID=A0A1D9GME1_9GAMM|nr:thiamine-phosphate kinase [Marinobacter salinus]AOY88808.1 thiamine-phosphate kinase [Marinobacter salinus]